MPPKSTEQELRDEIERFNIQFVGPLLPSEWPSQYSDVFKKVRKIGNTSWEQDESDEPEAPVVDNDTADRRRTKIRALELVREAKFDRKDRVNEPTLRGNAEPLIFERLRKAVKCNNCSKYLSLSEVAAEPTNLLDAERLRKRRSKMITCRCHPDELTVDGFDDAGETKFFRNYSEEFVHLDVSDRFRRRKPARHKPDMVWGLRKTKSVGQYRSEFDKRHEKDNLRHSPFASSDHLYPFLIVESKREGKGPGFEYAEAQSAFPIRTCLKLQQALQRVSAQPLIPFVWFIAYQGDEWRVAACVIVEDQYHIYDLWMGRVTSKAGALQLLLIIDHIAEWARETYRFDILCCLAGGRERILGADNMSETYKSRRSTQSVFSSSLPGRRRPSDLVIYQDREDTVMEDLGTSARTNVRQEKDTNELHHFLRWLRVPVSPQSQFQTFTVRHASMVVFSFSHLSIPPNRKSLEQILGSFSGPNTAQVEENAFSLLSKFRDQGEGLVVTTRLRIDLLKSEWLRLGPTMTNSMGTGVRALFSVRTWIRRNDWQIERKLVCISCSREAAQELASIAGIRAEDLRVSTEWAAEKSEFPSASFAELRSMVGRFSASAAINSRVFHLIYSSALGAYQWMPPSAVNELTKSCFLWSYGIGNDDAVSAAVDGQVNKAMEVLGKPALANNIKHILQPQPLLEGSAALLRRVPAEGDNSSTPVHCLMIFKQVDFHDARGIGDIMAEVKAQGYYYTVMVGDPFKDSVEARKERFDTSVRGNTLDRWMKELHS